MQGKETSENFIPWDYMANIFISENSCLQTVSAVALKFFLKNTAAKHPKIKSSRNKREKMAFWYTSVSDYT